MTAAVTKLHPFSLSTNWNPFGSKNSATIVEDDTVDKSYNFVKPKLPVGFGGSALSVIFPSNSEIIAEALSKEGSTDTLLASAPDVIRSFFQPAENNLSAGKEITALYALSLLRRIRELVVDIRPKNLQGVVHAFVDAEDRSATIEWIRNRSRLGFVLDQENESSWFIVLSNGFSDSGYLYGDSGLRSLRGLLEKFIVAGESPL